MSSLSLINTNEEVSSLSLTHTHIHLHVYMGLTTRVSLKVMGILLGGSGFRV